MQQIPNCGDNNGVRLQEIVLDEAATDAYDRVSADIQSLLHKHLHISVHANVSNLDGRYLSAALSIIV